MQRARALFRSPATFAAMAVVAASSGYALQAVADGPGRPSLLTWPASLAPVGDGYPRAGDLCRRLGESPATSAYLDHTATLVGCPGVSDSASALAIVRDRGGRVVGVADGVTMISVPNEGGTIAAAATPQGVDAGITSVGTLRCTRRVGEQMRSCRFRAIQRGGYTTVVVDLPHGHQTRTIFFDPSGTVIGAATRPSGRPRLANVTARRRGDVIVVNVGAERYEMRDSVLRRP